MPEPRDLLPHVVECLRATFGDRLRCVLLTGSVKRGDWIPYYSDLDVQCFVDGVAASGPDAAEVIELQRCLGNHDPTAYQIAAIQVLVFGSGYPPDFGPPWRDTIEVVFGELPDGLLPRRREFAQLRRRLAETTLATIDRGLRRLASKWTSARDNELPPLARDLAGLLKDALIAVMTITDSPERALTASRDEVSARVDAAGVSSDSARQFFALAMEWQRIRDDSEIVRRMFEAGHGFLRAVAEWNSRRVDPAALGRRLTDLRRAKGWSQSRLSERTVEIGKPVSAAMIEVIESSSKPYALPRHLRSPYLAIQAVVEALEANFVELLSLRSDEEIASSCFAHVLPRVQELRQSKQEPVV